MVKTEYLDNPQDTEGLLAMLCPPVRNWFKDKFPDFTRPQKLAIPAIMDRKHLLLCSPTGSGKTLTAFSYDTWGPDDYIQQFDHCLRKGQLFGAGSETLWGNEAARCGAKHDHLQHLDGGL